MAGEWDELPEPVVADPEAVAPGYEGHRTHAGLTKLFAARKRVGRHVGKVTALRKASIHTNRADKLLRDFSGGE